MFGLIPLETVRSTFFDHLGADEFSRRARAQRLGFPVVCSDQSQKSTMFVHEDTLRAYLDGRVNIACHDHKRLNSGVTKELPMAEARGAAGL
jgi:hypothetical protein